MCRALQVLCAAPGRERLGELKRATVSAEYELTGGVTDAESLLAQVEELEPDAVVADAGLGTEAIEALRAAYPSLRIVVVGAEAEAADESVARDEDVRSAVLGIPRPGGPVR
jgi:DNA-binding NarL/FixJ family response regulator